MIYNVTKSYLRHFFLYKSKEPFYHGNQSIDFKIKMDPVKKFEGTLTGTGTSCGHVPGVSLDCIYKTYPLGLRTITGLGKGFIPEHPNFEMPVNFVGIRLFFGWEIYVSHTYNIRETISGKRKWGLQVTLHKLVESTDVV